MIRLPPRSTLFPTRRSSDLAERLQRLRLAGLIGLNWERKERETDPPGRNPQDRKSTRLNSSHRTISYAVFCLKKKKRRSRAVHRRAARTPARTAPRRTSAPR